MPADVLCLRPKADFDRVNVTPPSSLEIEYRKPDDVDVASLMKIVRALVIPAVGPALPADLFTGSTVRLVQVTGAGLDRLNRPILVNLGIAVANVPGGSNTALAEYAVTNASVLLRRFFWADAEIRAGNYAAFRARMVADNLPGLEGMLVGVIGIGVIGLAVAKAFHNMGCRICYFDPAPRDPQAVAELGAAPVSLEQLLQRADIVTLHVPLLPATQGLIGESQLTLMKPGAVLIQASRGGIVDEAALAACLRSGKIGGAAIDVYAQEPPAADHPLLALEGEAARRVLFTPHIAGVTRQASENLFRSAWRNVERVLVEGLAPLDRAY